MMLRRIPQKEDRDRNQMIFKKYKGKCWICSYSFKPALAVHHIRPVAYGGSDDIRNLILLCANCHKLSHSSYEWDDWVTCLGKRRYSRLIRLRAEIDRSKEKSNPRNLIPLEKAVEIILKHNKAYENEKRSIIKSIRIVWSKIPKPIRKKTSVGLVRSNKYISINIMNWLAMRVPSYSDHGRHPDSSRCMAFLLYPEGKWKNETDDLAFTFKRFEGVDLCLTLNQILKFDSRNWANFKLACEMAVQKPSRMRTHNIDMDRQK